MKNIKRDFHRHGRASTRNSQRSHEGTYPRNLEGNDETPLLGQALDERTPLWQHENVWIRRPAMILKYPPRYNWVKLAIFATSHLAFLALFLVVGIPMCISLSKNDFPYVLLPVESVTIVAWVAFARYTHWLYDRL
ncbi:hypothetical protein BDW02DRAFT_573963 [Decorospora gaudefroyi]|uniref:Uncharacterized protein n=1 Tax=Decorospora gaudefroyi TaxID=184978 RepID=A0A6A5K073_9PLEO|nr:hypothetical protein BDW02DRAFT_573963 [Decorospora gaudefroyi]